MLLDCTSDSAGLQEWDDAFDPLFIYVRFVEHAIIEFKARCGDQARIREILKSRNARFVGKDHQIDTYFRVPEGRLKLRAGSIENALVYYSRPNAAGPKQSDVTLSTLPADNDVGAVLARSLGVLATVDKTREIYFVGNVKVHLDCVEGLGQFVEVEAIGNANEASRLREQCEAFLAEFQIGAVDLVEGSYSDLLMNKPLNRRL